MDRDFEKIAERDGVDGLIGDRLKEEADEVFSSWRAFQEGFLTRSNLQKASKKHVRLSDSLF